MKPLIGVMPLVDDEKESLWMLPGYMDGITEAGGIPIMLPLTADIDDIKQLIDTCDGLLFTGGHDVSPDIYNGSPDNDTVVSCAMRDKMESIAFDLAVEKDMPILGICRGIQFINAVLGGTLYQDLPTEHPSDIDHHQNPPYDIPIHNVRIMKYSPLYELLQKEELEVNSYHHQAIKDLSPELVAMAYSPDGLVEAVYKPDNRFVWALQWHPEFSHKSDENSKKIFGLFVSYMRQEK